MEQPSPHAGSFLGSELLLSVSQRQGLGPVTLWAPDRGRPTPQAARAHGHHVPAYLYYRFAERAVFILFCMFAILLFFRDPKFIPGWSNLFKPG